VFEEEEGGRILGRRKGGEEVIRGTARRGEPSDRIEGVMIHRQGRESLGGGRGPGHRCGGSEGEFLGRLPLKRESVEAGIRIGDVELALCGDSRINFRAWR
jgi:hypothetical protein